VNQWIICEQNMSEYLVIGIRDRYMGIKGDDIDGRIVA
jgi:hypothetical protein